jgi:hypothetical protein
VTARGNHRNDIFFKHADRTLIDELMADAVSRTGARVQLLDDESLASDLAS